MHYLTYFESSFSKCITVGDFNFPDIDWSTLMGTSIPSNSFCNFVFDCNLTEHVLEPTHIKGDLVLTSASVFGQSQSQSLLYSPLRDTENKKIRAL